MSDVRRAWDAAVDAGDVRAMRALLSPDAMGDTGAHVACVRSLRTTGKTDVDRSSLVHAPMASVVSAPACTALHVAMRKGYTDAIALLLQAGADPNVLDINASTPLYMGAANPRRYAELQLLLEYSANVHLLQNGETVLHRATKAGHATLVELFLQFGSCPNMLNKAWETPLHVAARKQEHGIVALLLQYGANANVFDNTGTPLLLQAIANGNDVLARLLLDGGADCNLRDARGHTSMHAAVASSQHLLVRKMLQHHDGDVNLRDKRSIGVSSLELALQRHDTAMVHILLASDTVSTETRLRSLRVAIELHSVVLARLVIANHARLCNEAGHTALHVAALCGGDVAMATMLREMGVPLNTPDKMGCTPLAYVAQRRHVSLFKHLAATGAVIVTWPLVAQDKYRTSLWPWLLECSRHSLASLLDAVAPLLATTALVRVLAVLLDNAFTSAGLAVVELCLHSALSRRREIVDAMYTWAVAQRRGYLVKCFADLRTF
ncbi:hypothetical protein SDRG_11364 [Saprolegnia diclina VS20]|uniref:Uncharacterized protein n=1 Tax=Saprolegnia diclina (strain VS20) TaxID=1156394 RepID=T0RF28_SAPDV|nr:hypothetical protein SDRG_11364 [Saprolegnia diclina VS20]EQC30883.1 hypothetical protein SDRG_11364 [Saprolegnia diclina VS20]|eukprot:XP_008615621.1 hypothetical protein SDRG_11364 [Saprolegnia diclina VS20]